jgi:hypothetical protein
MARGSGVAASEIGGATTESGGFATELDATSIVVTVDPVAGLDTPSGDPMFTVSTPIVTATAAIAAAMLGRTNLGRRIVSTARRGIVWPVA